MLTYILLIVFVAAAVALAWFLIARDKGEKEPILALWLAAGFGLAGAFMASFLEARLINGDNLLPGTPTTILLPAAVLVGVIEEACKFLPLAVFIYKKRYFNENTDGIIYFALAGLGFGLPENIIYTINLGTEAGITRLLLTPLFHAAITGVVGYYLAKGKMSGKSVLNVVLPLSLVMIIHGLYDFGLLSGTVLFSTMALLITLLCSAGLFLLFMRATTRDQQQGLSVVGNNSYCRSCGSANPNNHLYCTHCGKNA